MTIKELVLNEMPSDLSDLQKARYIYIKLGGLLSFSTKFNNTLEEDEINMRLMHISINDFNSNQVNCNMWSDLYSQLLNEVGIKNEIINLGHKYVEFYINNKRWVADATYGNYTDLARIHNNDETTNFGVSLFQNEKHGIYINHSDDDMNLLREIDNKLGYNLINDEELDDVRKFILDVKNGKFSFDDVLGQNATLLEKVEYLFCKLGVLKNGYYETKDFVYYIEKLLFNKEDFKSIKAAELKRTNANKEVDIIQCIYVNDGEKYHYYLLAPKKPIVKVRKDQIIKLSLLGYGIERDSKIPNVCYPKVFKLGKVSNYKLFKTYNKQRIARYGIESYDENQYETFNKKSL